MPSNSVSMFHQLYLPTVRRTAEAYQVHWVTGNRVRALFVFAIVNSSEINMIFRSTARYYSCQGDNSKTKLDIVEYVTSDSALENNKQICGPLTVTLDLGELY